MRTWEEMAVMFMHNFTEFRNKWNCHWHDFILRISRIEDGVSSCGNNGMESVSGSADNYSIGERDVGLSLPSFSTSVFPVYPCLALIYCFLVLLLLLKHVSNLAPVFKGPLCKSDSLWRSHPLLLTNLK